MKFLKNLLEPKLSTFEKEIIADMQAATAITDDVKKAEALDVLNGKILVDHAQTTYDFRLKNPEERLLFGITAAGGAVFTGIAIVSLPTVLLIVGATGLLYYPIKKVIESDQAEKTINRIQNKIQSGLSAIYTRNKPAVENTQIFKNGLGKIFGDVAVAPEKANADFQKLVQKANVELKV